MAAIINYVIIENSKMISIFNPHGFVVVKDSNGKFGVINNKGEWVLSPKDYFKRMKIISSTNIIPTEGTSGKWGLMDINGEWVKEPIFKNIFFPYLNGYFPAQDDNDKWGIINESGDWVIGAEYTDLPRSIHMDNTKLIVVTDKNMGSSLIDLNGNVLIEPQKLAFIDLLNYQDLLVAYKVEGLKPEDIVFLNFNGDLRVPVNYDALKERQ
jgi:hypothetical protein